MEMTRRSFLKVLAASAGIAFVPDISYTILVTEPEWVVEEFDFGRSFGVVAVWPNGKRHAVEIYEAKATEENVELCKQALREWYRVKHLKVA